MCCLENVDRDEEAHKSEYICNNSLPRRKNKHVRPSSRVAADDRGKEGETKMSINGRFAVYNVYYIINPISVSVRRYNII